MQVTQVEGGESLLGGHIGVTALHAAVLARGHAEVVQILLSAGSLPDARTRHVGFVVFACGRLLTLVCQGNTPLLYAANGGYVDCIRCC